MCVYSKSPIKYSQCTKPNTSDHVEIKKTRWDFAPLGMEEDLKSKIVCSKPKDSEGLCAEAVEWSATKGTIGSTSRRGRCPQCERDGLY
jgi:hypothetical protein